MSAANVVSLFGHRRRANRKEDAEIISLRRLATSMGRIGHEQENVTALAMSLAMERKMPCNQLRLIMGTKDERRDFEVRLQDVEIAGAERQAADAKRIRTRILYGEDAVDRFVQDEAWERYRQAVVDMANTPVFTQADLRRKRAAIGTVWLRAEGEWYDQLRAAVAADEARLTKRREA